MLKSNAPIKPPYKVELTGLEVIGQVPEMQPICCQYRYPAPRPAEMPTIVSQYFLRRIILLQVYAKVRAIEFLESDLNHNRVILFRACFTSPSFSSSFITRETASRAVPNSSASCWWVIFISFDWYNSDFCFSNCNKRVSSF